MKKKILLALSFVLVAILSVGVTVALLTSEDFDHNTMTIGQAEIKQLEYQRKVDANGNWITSSFTGYGYTADEMEEFKQDELLLPTTSKSMSWDMRNGSQDDSGPTSHQQPWSQIGAPGSNQLFDKSNTNVKDKFVFVQNTGKVDVYFRTIILIEAPEGTMYEENGKQKEAIALNVTTNDRYDWDLTKEGQQPGTQRHAYKYVTVNGTRYAMTCAQYTEVLAPGEISRPSLLQLYMGQPITNEQIAKFGDKVDVLVLTQAVQAKGYSDAETALNDAFGELSVDNHPLK